MSTNPTPKTCTELAELTGTRLVGDETLMLTGVASLEEATPSDVSFLGNDKYRSKVLTSAAGAVFLPADFAEEPPAGRAWLVADDPSAAFQAVVQLFAPPPVTFPPGQHPSAVVDASAQVAESAHIGPCAVIAAGAVVGEKSVVAAGCYVGENTRIGDDCLIYPNVTIRERCVLGNRIIIHSGTTVGSDGFGFIPGPQGHTKIPQVGIVQIDDDVEIGANAAIDRARFGKTWIKTGAKVDNLVQIAHNVVIGEHCFVVAQVGISGSSRIGQGVILAGQVGIAGHLEIGPGAIVMAQCGVPKDIPAGARVVGSPAMDRREFAKTLMVHKQFDRFKKNVKDLQQEVAELREQLADKG